MSKILVTGGAGFIGYHTTERLLADGHEVVGLDNMNTYYDVRYKQARLERLQPHENFSFVKMDLSDREGMKRLFGESGFDRVINLAAYAGVRHSIEHPEDYVDTNLVGFGNVLEGCRRNGVEHLVYASSSSVYGANRMYPSKTTHPTAHPVSFYAATKLANEHMAHSYAQMFGVPSTGLRFFTVYGPWGRPDMALFLFTDAILKGEPIQVFNHGDMQRDFTYIDDIVEGVVRLVDIIPEADPDWTGEDPTGNTSNVPWRLYNIGNNGQVELMDMIRALEKHLGIEAKKNFMGMQIGDVKASYADVGPLVRDTGYHPGMPIEEGIGRFVEWYRAFHGVE